VGGVLLGGREGVDVREDVDGGGDGEGGSLREGGVSRGVVREVMGAEGG